MACIDRIYAFVSTLDVIPVEGFDVNCFIPCDDAAGLLLLLIFSFASLADPKIFTLDGARNGETLYVFFSVRWIVLIFFSIGL